MREAFVQAFLQKPGVDGALHLHREFFSDNLIRLLQEARDLCAEQSGARITEKHLMQALLSDRDGVVVYTLTHLGLDVGALADPCEEMEE